jgi:spore germination cell wall hydrolase CwlJ-like protein
MLAPDPETGNDLLRLILIAAIFAALAPAAHAGSAAPKPQAVACLAEAVYFEARGKGETAALAVANVVLNRQEHREFPGTVCGVVTDGCQFSYRCDGKPDALRDPAERDRALRAAEAVLAGDAPDPTHGALFFHAAAIDPGWFATRDRTTEIGGNVFYR